MKLDPPTALAIILSVIGSIFLMFFLINEAYDRGARNPQPRQRKRRAPKPRTRELDFGIIPVPIEIIALTHNKETAYRLYDNLRAGYPHQSDAWIWDKIKWDIIRDRR